MLIGMPRWMVRCTDEQGQAHLELAHNLPCDVEPCGHAHRHCDAQQHSPGTSPEHPENQEPCDDQPLGFDDVRLPDSINLAYLTIHIVGDELCYPRAQVSDRHGEMRWGGLGVQVHPPPDLQVIQVTRLTI